MIPLPKGFKLPEGMSFKDAQRAMQATGECARLVEQLLKDADHANLLRLYIREHENQFPILCSGLDADDDG